MQLAMKQILSSLNPQQLEAVTTTEGPVLVLAGAGSGKTRVITVRTAYLIVNNHIKPENILSITFTNKAAEEMRERIHHLLEDFGQNYKSPLTCTFHSLCARILRQEIEQLQEGYTRNFNIYDSEESEQVIKSCIKNLGIDEKKLTPKFVQALISGAKNCGEDLESYIQDYPPAKKEAIFNVAASYNKEMKNANALDFDDLLLKTVQLLQKNKEIRHKYNKTFKYIMVDEYQDTNPLQFALLRLLTELQQNICVVGDDAQSIYGFRHADIRNILDFEKYYPSAKVIRLEQNYRSTKTILNVAEAVIRNNLYRKDKKLWTNNPEGEKIYYYNALNGEDEAEFVAFRIKEILRSDPQKKIAVLYRTNAQSRLFEEALRRHRLKYKIVGGFSFYQRTEIKDLVAYLKVILNPFDNLALERIINVPQREIGDRTLDKIRKIAKELNISLWEVISAIQETKSNPQALISASGNSPIADITIQFPKRTIAALGNFKSLIERFQRKITLIEKGEKSVSSFVKDVIEESGYLQMLISSNNEQDQSRAENLFEFVNAAMKYDEEDKVSSGLLRLRELIDYATLTSSTDDFDEASNLTLMTVHAAKGLEFSVVFLVGLEQGIFPHLRSLDNEHQLEEERRLCYVALTRAKETLFITHAKKRYSYASEIENEPSVFLEEMPHEYLEDISFSSSWLSSKTKKMKKQTIDNTYKEAVMEFLRKKALNTDSISTKLAKEEPKQTQNSRTHEEFVEEIYPGTYVQHEKYGRGFVLKKEGKGETAKLTISFPGFGIKKLMEKYAKLRRA
jgi:DNA helicase-2/ATP-dependent DNA helicase PcrA